MKTEPPIFSGSSVSPVAGACPERSRRVVQGFAVNQAESPAQISQARELFLEYAQSLGFSLCFQDFDKELANLPGDYTPPQGRLLLATYENELAGCVALHPIEPGTCEMKRLYLRPPFRGKGLGRALADQIIAEARQIGYQRMRLDTVEPRMMPSSCTAPSASRRSRPIVPIPLPARCTWNCSCNSVAVPHSRLRAVKATPHLIADTCVERAEQVPACILHS